MRGSFMPIGRLHHVIVDCPDPQGAAEFYSALLGQPITYTDQDFAVVSVDDHTSGLAFQRSADQRPPTWPDPAVPQQIHLDVMVDDLPRAREAVLALGATELSIGDHVFADPAGHPFCLIPRPGWAAPVDDGRG
jgi:catechol 2,3-dioxygenase-like lactoylglutathione lyase family enzyme